MPLPGSGEAGQHINARLVIARSRRSLGLLLLRGLLPGIELPERPGTRCATISEAASFPCRGTEGPTDFLGLSAAERSVKRRGRRSAQCRRNGFRSASAS